MEKEFIPYDRALRMKALGFDEPCFGIFFPSDKSWKDLKFRNSQQDNIVASPTFSQAFRWFREKYDMAHQVTYAGAKGRYNAFTDDWVYDSNGELKEFSYEEAELACLDKLIEIVESKQRINRIIKDVQDGK